MRQAVFYSAILILVSCNNGPKPETFTGASNSKDSIPADSIPSLPVKDRLPPASADTVPKNIQVDTVIHLAFAPDSISLTARGSINSKSSPVICYIEIPEKCNLQATIIPDDNKLNVRFSQIIMPDNSSDGPFSRQLKYRIKQRGRYKFIISPNNMAEGKRNGNFLLRMRIS